MSQEFDLVGVVCIKPASASGGAARALGHLRNPVAALQHLAGRWIIRRENLGAPDRGESLLSMAAKGASCISVESINQSESVEFIKAANPELIFVNGTNLLREPILKLIPQLRYGCINLHTGLSPYSRGGNCNLFMLLEGKPEFVGITVHHVSAGIDDGDIIVSARPELTENDTFQSIESKCFSLGIAKLIKAGKQLIDGTAPRVAQWEEGKLFLKRTGYVYRPWHRYLVSRRIKAGLIANYLKHQSTRDRSVTLVEIE